MRSDNTAVAKRVKIIVVMRVREATVAKGVSQERDKRKSALSWKTMKIAI